jgi:hypothetical protein
LLGVEPHSVKLHGNKSLFFLFFKRDKTLLLSYEKEAKRLLFLRRHRFSLLAAGAAR